MIRRAIADDDPEVLIQHVSGSGVNAGVDWRLSFDETAQQLRTRKGFLYCKLYNTDCFMKEAAARNANSAALELHSIRDILLHANDVKIDVKIDREELGVGYMEIIWDERKSHFQSGAFGFPTATLVYENGKWRLRDAFSSL